MAEIIEMQACCFFWKNVGFRLQIFR